MPRIDDSQVADDQLYGVREVETNITFRERMAKRFKAHDTVQVKNIDTEPIKWQWLAEDDETFTMDEDIKIVERGRPGLWQIDAGEKDVLEGGCAYLMIDALFKKMAVKRAGGPTEHPLDEREIKNFSFDDPEAQEAFLDRVFLGKLSPHAMQAALQKQLGKPTNVKEPKTTKQPAAAVTEE